MGCAHVGFTFATAQQMAENVAQTLAYSETQGAFWLSGSLAAVHLMSTSVAGDPRAIAIRVVLCVDRAEVARMLSVDRWVTLQTHKLHTETLERHGIPHWIIAESADDPNSNLACAKHLAELLLLLLDKMAQIAHNDHRTFASWFWHTVNNTKHEDQMPPALNYSQRIGLMDLADAWRDHIVSVWQSSGALTLARLPPLPPLPVPPPKLDTREFPALGASPAASPAALRGCTTLDCTKIHSALDADRPVCIPKINQDDAARLWRVAWLGDSACNEALWLRCGESPQNIAGRSI